MTAVRGAKEAIEDFEVPEGIIWTELERQTETLNNFAKAAAVAREEKDEMEYEEDKAIAGGELDRVG